MVLNQIENDPIETIMIILLSIIIYIVSGFIIGLLAIVVNNNKTRLNCLGLENKNLFQEFFLVSVLFPFIALLIIGYRFTSYTYVKSYEEALNEYNEVLLENQV